MFRLCYGSGDDHRHNMDLGEDTDKNIAHPDYKCSDVLWRVGYSPTSPASGRDQPCCVSAPLIACLPRRVHHHCGAGSLDCVVMQSIQRPTWVHCCSHYGHCYQPWSRFSDHSRIAVDKRRFCLPGVTGVFVTSNFGRNKLWKETGKPYAQPSVVLSEARASKFDCASSCQCQVL